MSTDPQGSTHGPRRSETVDDTTPRAGRRGLWPARTSRRDAGRPGRQGGQSSQGGSARVVGLVTAAVAGLAVVSTGVAIGAGSARTATETPENASTAAAAHPQPGGASSVTPDRPPVADEPVGDPEDVPTVEMPPSSGPPVIEWDDLPEPSEPDPAPEPVATLPPLPTLPPLAPVPDVVAPGAAPSDPTGPTAPTGPTVPTLTGPGAGTVLTTFPTVSGVADPGAAVVVASASGDVLATAVADSTGTWSAQVCSDPATDPPGCLAVSEALTVTAHARDDARGAESGRSAALSWTFERPVLTEPTDGAAIEVPAGGDVPLRVDGTVGELVQLSVDGTPTGELHRVASGEALVWRSPSAGTRTLSLRYVTVGDGGAEVTGYGPSRTWTVTVAEAESAPEGTQTSPGEAPAESPAEDPHDAPASGPAATAVRPGEASEPTPGGSS